MAQIARNITSEASLVFAGATHSLDRDAKFTENFRRVLGDPGIEVVRTRARRPQANGVAERSVGTARREVLNRLVFFGIAALTYALPEFVDHHARSGHPAKPQKTRI